MPNVAVAKSAGLDSRAKKYENNNNTASATLKMVLLLKASPLN